MMGIARKAQLKQQISLVDGYQATIQAAKHTLCTAPPAFPTDNVSYEESPNYCQDFEAIGEVVRSPGYGEHAIEFERLTAADFIMLAELAMAGGKSPTGAGPYVWTHNSADTDDLAYVAAEVGAVLGSSGSSFIKTLQNGQVENLEITIDSEKSYITAKIKMRGDETEKIASFSTTEAVGHATTKVKTSWVQLFIDDTAGGIGTTAMTCNRLKVMLTLDNAFDSVQTDCGPKHGRDRRFMQLDLRLLLDTNSDDEYIDWAAETVRYVRIKATDPTTSEYVQWDWSGVMQTYSHGEAGPFLDLSLMGKGQRDSTLGFSWQQVVSHDDADALDYYNS